MTLLDFNCQHRDYNKVVNIEDEKAAVVSTLWKIVLNIAFSVIFPKDSNHIEIILRSDPGLAEGPVKTGWHPKLTRPMSRFRPQQLLLN